jgi:glycosyltransferase involved in cell wall biosynthesis
MSMPESKPLLSVITVVWNNRAYIGKAIGNFLSQECSKAELIIVDGGSTDGTVEEIERLTLGIIMIRWISESDKGQSDAMNKGIKMARGEYISFLNVDDFYSDGALNDVMPLISGSNAPEFIVGNCNVWDAAGNLVYVNRPRSLRSWNILSGQFLPVNPTAYFYRKSVHDRAGYYTLDNHINMDLEFLAKASLVTSIAYANRDWGNFRLLPGTKTSTDMEAGTLEERKLQLFKRINNNAPIHVRLMTLLTVVYIWFSKSGQAYWSGIMYYPKAAIWKINHFKLR